MAKTLHADYSLLEHSLLHMWVPVAGVHTAADFWRKNLEKCLDVYCSRFDVIPSHLLKWVLQKAKERLLNAIVIEHFVFKTNFESYFDIEPPFQLNEAILTGSLSEGLFLMGAKPPDMDFMCVLKNINFSVEDQKNGCLLLREDTPFVYAFITNEETQSLWREFLDEPDSHKCKKNRLSSKKIKEKMKENYQKKGSMFHTFGKEQFEEVSNGAAVTINNPIADLSLFALSLELTENSNQPLNELSRLAIGKENTKKCLQYLTYKLAPSSDIVLAVHCDGWPFCAEEWIKRERLWPEEQLVEEITKAGYHIVPKSSQEGNFRLSFSYAETKLIETLTSLQHKVMRAFKAAVKHNQNKWIPNIDKILSSYHLKTIALWYFEKTPKTSWTEETLVHHLVSLLENLSEALGNHKLPMYFMPKVNLLKDVDDPDDALKAMEKISQLCQDFSALCEAVESTDVSKIFFDRDDFINSFHELFERRPRLAGRSKEIPLCSIDLVSPKS